VVLRALVVSLLLTLLGRLWYLQVLAGPEYARAAADNQKRDIITTAPRGEIVDDRGRAFARNKTALVVSVDRVAMQRQGDCIVITDPCTVLHRLSNVLHGKFHVLFNRIQLCGAGALPKGCWNGSAYEPVPVSQLKADRASTRLALQILERKEDFPGVTAELAAVRNYAKPKGAFASQMIGNLAPITQEELDKLPKAEADARLRDLVGKQGLEQQYDKYLRGRAGIRQVAVDHIGGVTGTLKDTAPVPGDNLVTSLDARVQASLENALAGAVQHARQLGVHAYGGPADFAAGVVLNAQTGHVVAMGSYPSYDPSLWDGGRIDSKAYARLQKAPGSPLVDKAYSSAYSPGSSFKPISTSGLLHDGTASINGYYPCGSSYSIGATSFRNFEGETAGSINLHKTLVISCDTVYYYLAYHDWLRDEALVHRHKKPVEGVQHMARLYGIGRPPNIDLPNATVGHIADRRNTLLQWKATHKDYCIGAKRRCSSPCASPSTRTTASARSGVRSAIRSRRSTRSTAPTVGGSTPVCSSSRTSARAPSWSRRCSSPSPTRRSQTAARCSSLASATRSSVLTVRSSGTSRPRCAGTSRCRRTSSTTSAVPSTTSPRRARARPRSPVGHRASSGSAARRVPLSSA